MKMEIRGVVQVLALVTLLFFGCSTPTEVADPEEADRDTLLHVHVWAYFDDVDVRVAVNDNIVFDHRVRSTPTGAAEIAETGETAFVEHAVARGIQRFRVWEDGVVRGDTLLQVDDTLWVGIGRDRESHHVIIRAQSEPFLYW